MSVNNVYRLSGLVSDIDAPEHEKVFKEVLLTKEQGDWLSTVCNGVNKDAWDCVMQIFCHPYAQVENIRFEQGTIYTGEDAERIQREIQ